MDFAAISSLIKTIDAVSPEDMEARFTLLNKLLKLVSKELPTRAYCEPGLSHKLSILKRLTDTIFAIPEDEYERRYFQLVTMMIYLKRQALQDPTYQRGIFVDAAQSV